MHISNLYTTGFKQRNRDHFAAIVRIALADGVITDEEQAFINRTAINLEIEEEEVDQYQINPPSSKRVRLERLYDLARIVLVDNIADDAEKKLMHRLVIGLGFDADQANSIVEKSFIEIQKGCDEDDFISAF